MAAFPLIIMYFRYMDLLAGNKTQGPKVFGDAFAWLCSLISHDSICIKCRHSEQQFERLVFHGHSISIACEWI